MTRILMLSVSLWLFTACSDQQGSADTNSVTESTEEQMATVVESELTADVVTEPQPIIEYIWHKAGPQFSEAIQDKITLAGPASAERSSTDSIVSVICLILSRSRPSEKFGTHSTN